VQRPPASMRVPAPLTRRVVMRTPRVDVIAARRRAVRSGRVAGSRSLDGLAMDFAAAPEATGIVGKVRSQKTGDSERALIVRCSTLGAIGVSEVADELETHWRKLAFDGVPTAHELVFGPGMLTMEFVTTAGDGGVYTGAVEIRDSSRSKAK
jgi:hypothetical protein